MLLVKTEFSQITKSLKVLLKGTWFCGINNINTAPEPFLASQDALEVMFVTE